VHLPHSFDSDLSQMAELGPERRESMVSALPVLGFNGRVMVDRPGKMGIHGSLRRKRTGSKTWAPAKNGWKRGRLGE
jgi:hypothetical protein